MARCKNTLNRVQCSKQIAAGNSVYCLGQCDYSEGDGFQTVYATYERPPVTHDHKGPNMSPGLYKTPENARSSPDVSYYKGRGGLEARDVVAAFELGYNVGTAMVYCLRAGKKPGNTFEADIEKAINHLRFALEDRKRDV